MGFLPLFVLASLSFTAVALEPQANAIKVEETQLKINESGRKGKQIQIDRIELPFSGGITKQIVKIPPNVSKVKLINTTPILAPQGMVKQVSRVPTAFSQPYFIFNDRQEKEYDEEYDEKDDMFNPNNIKRNFQKFRTDESAFDENLEKSESLGLSHYLTRDETFKLKQYRPQTLKIKRKIPKQVTDYSNTYEIYKKPEKLSFRKENLGTVATNHYRPEEVIYYDNEPAEQILFTKKVEPSNVFNFKRAVTPDTLKLNMEKQILGKFYDANFRPTYSVKKAPSKGRKLINLQYTTHNPHVATNFGLSEYNGINSYHYTPKVQFLNTNILKYGTNLDKHNNPVSAASQQVVNSVYQPGIKVIQPPQFGENISKNPFSPSRLVSSPSQQQEQYANQKATIRDILEQDCPNHELFGFCESPPRYPMHQIGNIVKRCAKLMEAMSTQNLIDLPESTEISSRSDLDPDNYTISPLEVDREQQVAQRRTSVEGIQACQSEFNLIEPGYAKEVTTGRWIVIVQHPEISQQRITTDTCKNPGKPCAGLNDMKCIKIGSMSNKTTKCIQRYSYHRLISWDPDTPDSCPKMRIFKFPSACVCHLGVNV